MRPFKFFFMASLGVILFFALARVALFAFVMAAIMSVVFFIVKKTKYFFKSLQWEAADYPRDRNSHSVGIGFNTNRNSFTEEWEYEREFAPMSRMIHVH